MSKQSSYKDKEIKPSHKLSEHKPNTGRDPSGGRQPMQLSLMPYQKFVIKALAAILMEKYTHLILAALKPYIENPFLLQILIEEGLIDPEMPNSFNISEKDLLDSLTPQKISISRYEKIFNKLIDDSKHWGVDYKDIADIEGIKKYISDRKSDEYGTKNIL